MGSWNTSRSFLCLSVNLGIDGVAVFRIENMRQAEKEARQAAGVAAVEIAKVKKEMTEVFEKECKIRSMYAIAEKDASSWKKEAMERDDRCVFSFTGDDQDLPGWLHRLAEANIQIAVCAPCLMFHFALIVLLYGRCYRNGWTPWG